MRSATLTELLLVVGEHIVVVLLLLLHFALAHCPLHLDLARELCLHRQQVLSAGRRVLGSAAFQGSALGVPPGLEQQYPLLLQPLALQRVVAADRGEFRQ